MSRPVALKPGGHPSATVGVRDRQREVERHVLRHLREAQGQLSAKDLHHTIGRDRFPFNDILSALHRLHSLAFVERMDIVSDGGRVTYRWRLA